MAGKRRKAAEKRLKTPGKRRNRKKAIVVTVLILLLAVTGAAAYFVFFDGKVLSKWLSLANIQKLGPPGRLITCPIDGSVVKDERLIDRRPLLIKVENLPEARPQSGLDKADVVIESMAEGGIVRFAAVYLCRDAGEIGPVRSARLQDITFIHEYDALFAHVGGSDAWERERTSDIADLDQFFYDDAYWRSDNRDSPHNVYTTTARLHKAAVDEGMEETIALDEWTFKTDKPGKGNVIAIDVPYPADCAVHYDYDKGGNKYLRSVEGEPFMDQVTKSQLAPKNVIVMYVSYSSSDDGEEYGMGGHDIMELVGEGRAVVCRDGEAIDGRWVKSSEEGRTMFLDAAGQPIALNRGQVWISIVPESWEVTFGSVQPGG